MINFFKKNNKISIFIILLIIAILLVISSRYSFSMDDLIDFFKGYAYQPYKVYMFVVLFMIASSFGLPIPEEVTLVSVGLIAFMASHPNIYKPPTPDAVGVNTYTLAIVAFFAVSLSDILVYSIGRFLGNRSYFKKKMERGDGAIHKVNKWFENYGTLAIFFFRFAPGIRFLGHMTCGITRIKLWKFVAVDSFATSISVPTQVLLVAFYGKTILEHIKEFKLIMFAIIMLAIVIYFVKKHLKEKKLETL